MDRMKYRIIALDLDGTLLTTDKRITEANMEALRRAAEAGAYIVPATGRILKGLPAELLAAPFLRYAITVNGAMAEDVKEGRVLHHAGIDRGRALEILSFLDTEDVVYDCYMNGWGKMTRTHYEKADLYAPDEHFLKMIRTLRTPVDDLKEYIRKSGEPIEKVQFFARNPAERDRIMAEVGKRFPEMSLTYSAAQNLEINSPEATKGNALMALARHLGVPAEEVMAIGDSVNDLSMIRAAGCGVVMGNGLPQVLAEADYVTAGNDEDGVAKAILHFI